MVQFIFDQSNKEGFRNISITTKQREVFMRGKYVFIIIFIVFLVAPDFAFTKEKNTVTKLLNSRSITKLDFGIYRVEAHLEDHFKRINPDRKYDIFPDRFNVFYSSEKDKIIINAMCFPTEGPPPSNQNELKSLMKIGFNEIRDALAVPKDRSIPKGGTPTFLTKYFFPSYWDKLENGWQNNQRKIYETMIINYAVIYVTRDGDMKKYKLNGPLLSNKFFFSNE